MLIVLSNGQVLTSWDLDQERQGEKQHRQVPLSRFEHTLMQARLQEDLDDIDQSPD